VKQYVYKPLLDKLSRNFLTILMVTTSLLANANHEKSEPSDGTVRSFMKVKTKMDVSSVTFFDSR